MSSQHAHQFSDYQLVIRLAACRIDHVTHQWRRFATIRTIQTVRSNGYTFLVNIRVNLRRPSFVTRTIIAAHNR